MVKLTNLKNTTFFFPMINKEYDVISSTLKINNNNSKMSCPRNIKNRVEI